MRRPIFILLFFVLLGPAMAVAATTPAEAQIDISNGPLPVFEFHSSFWVNLHHTLYQQARLRRDIRLRRSNPSAAVSPMPHLSDSEQRAWNDAVDYYAQHYADKDPLFNLEIVLVKNQLGDFEGCEELAGLKRKTCDAGLSEKLTQVLDAAAPVYRAHLWSEHDSLNRKWIANVAPLVRYKSLALAEQLAQIYLTKWPREKVRVDVCPYVHPAGAYTTLDPLRVSIASTDPRNQGSASLEVLFHEASHGIAEPVKDAIVRECRQRDKAIPRDLWEALILYTSGQVVGSVVDTTGSSSPPAKPESNAPPRGDSSAATQVAPPRLEGPDDPPHRSPNEPPLNTNPSPTVATPQNPPANSPQRTRVSRQVRDTLVQRGWQDYLDLLTRFWQPYLDGTSNFDDSIARMVSSL